MEIPACAEEVLASAAHPHNAGARRPACAGPRLGARALHLHAVLMRILGISAYYHDSAAALVVDGRIESAAQEERFTRRKHDARFPAQAIRFCLDYGRITP